jgi:hypothetical protein
MLEDTLEAGQDLLCGRAGDALFPKQLVAVILDCMYVFISNGHKRKHGAQH